MKDRGARKISTPRRPLVPALIGIGAWAVLALLGFVAHYAMGVDLFAKADRTFYEVWTSWRNSQHRSRAMSPRLQESLGKVAVIAIDEETLKDPRFNEWPIPRKRYAEMIDMLEKAGVKAIGIDVLFMEKQKAYPGADEALARAVEQYPNVFLVSHIVEGAQGQKVREPIYAEKWTPQRRREQVALVNIQDTRYGDYVMSVPLLVKVKPETRFSLDILVAAAAEGIPVDSIRPMAGLGWSENYIGFGPRLVPDQMGETWVNYFFGSSLAPASSDPNEEARRPQNHVGYYPMVALWDMTDEDRKYYLGNKVILVGVTAEAGIDVKSTPMGRMPGIDIHLNVVLSLLSGVFLHYYGGVAIHVVSALLALVLGLVLAFTGLRLGTLVYLLLVVGAGYVVPRHLIMQSTYFPAAMPIATVTLAFVFVAAWLTFQEQRLRERMSSFIREVAPMPDQFIEKYIASSGGDLHLGGSKQVVSILFSDIRGYTDMSERMDPDDVMNTLNNFYVEMGNVVHQHGGGIFDYIGDAQMVVFGFDERHREDHAEAALQAGIAMIRRLQDLNAMWARDHQVTIEIGVGIATGEVSLGIMGSQQRKMYSAIGDTTNVASRLEGLSKELKAPIIISEATFEQLKGDYGCERVEGVKVKGKAEPMTVYRVFATAPSKERETTAV